MKTLKDLVEVAEQFIIKEDEKFKEQVSKFIINYSNMMNFPKVEKIEEVDDKHKYDNLDNENTFDYLDEKGNIRNVTPRTAGKAGWKKVLKSDH